MTHRDKRRERCFGYMFEFPGHGIFEPTFGRLDVSSEDAKTHNQLLSQGEIAGLDQNCAVGMGGIFYAKKENGQTIVATWLGEVVTMAGEQCDFNKRDRDDALRWLLVQSTESVELKAMHRNANTQSSRAWIDVSPTRVIAFTTWPGDGCEAANIGLCQYPNE